MKYGKIILSGIAVIAILCSSNTTALAQKSGNGIGIIIGEPTGFDGKFWLTEKTAIDGALAWSFVRGNSFHIHADYLIHTSDAIKTEEPLEVYYGIGGRLKTSGDDGARLGLRGVAGLDYFLRDAPVDFFFELAPIMDVTPATELTFNGGIGVRWFF